ncbi:hypothetical protein [Spirosoma radiotolerans]|uniref:Uncharacterized protein n=1 Tax=Spirosoma radiotolerans TaxID=1379870 RepID=A0A0E3ZT04_9BACT|nr:hypothetical protein [Spirosoma radiotolerans]AKD53793.1 hypothetical protein SD10_01625 [Spirosoma radiotolerans]
MDKVVNYGILTSVDWNSKKWQAQSDEDLPHVDFGFVKENGITFTSLNFGQDLFPSDEKGYYSGLLPQLYTKTLDKKKSKNLLVVFIKSKDWHNGNTYIVGLYAFPLFDKGTKNVLLDRILYPFLYNVMSLPKDIHVLDTFINIDTYPKSKKFIPNDKEFGKQGFNYLTQSNVGNILDVMEEFNPNDAKLRSIKGRLLMAMSK